MSYHAMQRISRNKIWCELIIVKKNIIPLSNRYILIENIRINGSVLICCIKAISLKNFSFVEEIKDC